jgi:hypothetical protein
MVIVEYKIRREIERNNDTSRFYRVSDTLVSMIIEFFIPDFPSWFEGFEAFSNPSGSFGWLGTSPFSSMSITLNYFNNNHRDLGDIHFGVFLWFCKDKLCYHIFFPNRFNHICFSTLTILLNKGTELHFACDQIMVQQAWRRGSLFSTCLSTG